MIASVKSPGLPPLVSAGGPLGVYVHVPYCAVRCGYCDFNTYTNLELGGGGSREDYPEGIALEIEAAASQVDTNRPISTIFFGGGTPTLLPAHYITGIIEQLNARWGIEGGAEITVEANPDSLSPGYLEELASGGVTRLSIGMQSSAKHVLKTLDRTHDPARVPSVVKQARQCDMQVSLDLIYATPGESLADWRASLEAAVGMEPDHVSAYALVVEPGTRMGAQVRRGQIPLPSDDDAAEKYELADTVLSAAGYTWYEISNWSRGQESRCRHNLNYWRGGDWLALGPGAHGHVGGTRFVNAKHPRAWAQLLRAGGSAVVSHEVLSPPQRELERVMLGVRLREGIAVGQAHALENLAQKGLVEPVAASRGRAVLTLRGRLMADGVTTELTS